MRSLRFIFIGIITFLFVTNVVFLRRTVSVLLCGILSFNSASCYSFLSDYGKADAAVFKQIATQPNTPLFTSSAKQVDADHAEIRLIFPNDCEFISHLTKTPEGIIQNSLEYSHNNPEGCVVKPFTARYSNGGKTVEIQIKGQSDRLRLDASVNPGNIEQTYQDVSGKVQQQVTPIPTEILDYLKKLRESSLVEGKSSALPNLRDSQPYKTIQKPWLVASNNTDSLTKPDSATIALDISACGLAKTGESFCNGVEVVTGFSSTIYAFIPALGLLSLASGIVCWGLYGGFPPIFGIWETALVQKGVNLANAYSRNARRWGKNLPANQTLFNDLDRLLSETLPKVKYFGQLEKSVKKFAESLNGTDLKDVIPGALHDFLGSCKKEQKQASSTNDPHLVTFDGLKYDLQTVGEFTLIKSNHSDFEVQARQTPWNNSDSVSINSAVAMKVGSDRVAIYAQGLPDADTTTPLRVNGKPTTIQGEKLSLKGGGEILKQGGTYVVSIPTGEKVLVSLSGSFLNISPIVHNRSGKYNGLLGNVNGKPNDDQQIRGGGNVLKVQSTYGDVNKVLNQVGLRLPGVLDKAEKVYFDQLYKEFANSWRVKQKESLFDYPAGKTTKSYLDPSFPDKYLKLDMLSPKQIEKARNSCTEAKVSQELMEGCIFDVGFSGYSEFARATSEINGYVNIVNQLFPGSNIPTTGQVVDQVIQKVKPKVCLPFVGCV